MIEGMNDDLLRRLAPDDPTYANEYDGDPMCFFCGIRSEGVTHLADCPWVEARRRLGLIPVGPFDA